MSAALIAVGEIREPGNVVEIVEINADPDLSMPAGLNFWGLATLE